jgi:hypothetical protein
VYLKEKKVEGKIQKTGDGKYVLEPLKDIDRFSNTLADVRDRKIEKYKPIIR